MFGPEQALAVLPALKLVAYVRKHNLDRKEHTQMFIRRLESLTILLDRLGDIRDNASGNMSNMSRAWVMGTERRAWSVLHGLMDIIAPLMDPGLGRFNLLKAFLEGSGSRKIRSANGILDEQIDKIKECMEDLKYLEVEPNNAEVDTSSIAVCFAGMSTANRPQRMQQQQSEGHENAVGGTSMDSEELGGRLVEALGEALSEVMGDGVGE